MDSALTSPLKVQTKSSHQELFQGTFRALGGPSEIQLFAASPSEAQWFCSLVIDEVRRIERKYSRYEPESVLSKMNACAGKEWFSCDEETGALLDYADQCFLQSGGLFDVTSGVLRRVWNFECGRVPGVEELAQIVSLIGWQRIQRRSGEVFLPSLGMELDFGGFGKEYAVDRAAMVLEESGCCSALLNFGGDVRVVGVHPHGASWRIGVAHPRKDGVLAFSDLNDGAVATSGDYERFFERDGRRYCHILNPKSGMPVSKICSVSIKAASAVLAGTLSTLAMLREDLVFFDELDDLGVEYLAVLPDGIIRSSRGGFIPFEERAFLSPSE